MKQILTTMVATLCGLAVAVLGLDLVGVVDLTKLQAALVAVSPQHTLESPPVKLDAIVTGTKDTIGGVDTVVCEGTSTPERQADGSFRCIASVNLATECMGPDGEAYKNGEKRKFYKVAERNEENKKEIIECEFIEKVCVNGNFSPLGTSNDTIKPEFAHFDCKIIDTTKIDEIPCKTDDGFFVPPGSKQVRFLKHEVSADEDCVHIEEYCSADGKRRTNFPTHNMVKCDFKGSFSQEYIKKFPEKIFNTNGELNDIAKGDIKINPKKKSCVTPRGEIIQHGEKFISFREKVIRFDKECHSKTHTCVDGVLEFVEPYLYETCTIEGPDSCFIAETKVSVFHDSDKKLYKKGKYEGGKRVCEEQTRHCFDKILDGDTAYIYPDCEAPKTTGPASCPNPYVGENKAMAHGWEGIGYFKNLVAVTQDCDGEIEGKNNKVALSCAYGSIQPIGNTSKVWRSCSKGNAKDCSTPWGTKVEHGKAVTAYNVAGVSFGQSCESETRLCIDGKLEGSFQFGSCATTQALGCAHACGNVDHGGRVLSYTQGTVSRGGGETCSSSQVVSSCSNGKLSPPPADFCSCHIEQPKGCIGPNGESLTHLGYLTLYKFSSVPGKPEDGIDECPREVRQCVNGTLRRSDGSPAVFSYSYKKCDVVPPDGGASGTP